MDGFRDGAARGQADGRSADDLNTHNTASVGSLGVEAMPRWVRAWVVIGAIACGSSASAAELGLLLLKVSGAETADHGQVVTSGWQPRAYTLMNLDTKKSYTNFSPVHVWMAEVEDGIYCLASVRFADNLQFEYCGEPYFKVFAGRINNAGRWRFGASRSGRSGLIYALRDLEQTFDDARTADPDLVRKYKTGSN